MSYYVWLQYYCPAPVSKSIKSDELKYADKHQHAVQPTEQQKTSLLPSLYANVQAAYANYNVAHAGAPVLYPGDPTVLAGREVKTRSEK
jgi:hypothetical protein